LSSSRQIQVTIVFASLAHIFYAVNNGPTKEAFASFTTLDGLEIFATSSLCHFEPALTGPFNRDKQVVVKQVSRISKVKSELLLLPKKLFYLN